MSLREATGRLGGFTTLFPRPCPHCRPAGRGGPRIPRLPSFLLPGRPKAATRLCRHRPNRAPRGSHTRGGRTQHLAGATTAEGEEGRGPARGPRGAQGAATPAAGRTRRAHLRLRTRLSTPVSPTGATACPTATPSLAQRVGPREEEAERGRRGHPGPPSHRPQDVTASGRAASSPGHCAAGLRHPSCP